MKMKLLSLALLAAAAAVTGTAFPLSAQENSPRPAHVATAGAPDPAREIADLARQFRTGDLAGLAQGLIPRSKWEAARLGFEAKRREPTTESERAHFAAKIQEFTAADSVDVMLAKIEPEMAKARQQWAGMLLMGFGAIQVAINSPDSKLTEAQRNAIQSALPGVQRWATSTDFFSTDSMRRALTLLTDAARRTGITDLDQIKALPLEGVIDRASPMLAAGKEAARIYGLDLDAIADSLAVDVLDRQADTARVRVTVSLFGSPVWADYDLVLLEGHWYGKHMMADFREVADAND